MFAGKSRQTQYQEDDMKKTLIAGVAAIMVIVMAGWAMAASVPVDVSAAVSQKCVVASNGSLDIIIDPSLGVDQNFTAVQPVAKCTKTGGATTAAVTATSANGFTLVGAGLTPIPYTFTKNATVVGNGFGTGANVAFGIGGSVGVAAANAAEYGSYTDTVTLTLTY